jgi:16S rRNA G966 N2-methylase RsmD
MAERRTGGDLLLVVPPAILRRSLPAAVVDLVYFDPPFNSNRDYNVIFRDDSGNATDAQLLAFEDTRYWGPSAEECHAAMMLPIGRFFVLLS